MFEARRFSFIFMIHIFTIGDRMCVVIFEKGSYCRLYKLGLWNRIISRSVASGGSGLDGEIRRNHENKL